MTQRKLMSNIPISLSLEPTLENEEIKPRITRNKKRLVYISFLAILIAACISVIAKLLVKLIYFITNVSFRGELSFAHGTPVDNHLGWWVILIPAIGGVIVGITALYGSKAIRGHGIPEAMEQILTNQSKIKPIITFLKPISSAIAIGTGGPFGAEGPIIATGGALGSTFGQLLKITHNERKILLAAGATAGMAAIFGTPIAGIFLAVELLLFEFSPRSIVPCALACITGAAGHHLLFENGPVFPMEHAVAFPSNMALALYSLFGLLMGLVSIFVTKIVYWIEDLFEKIPIHWMWYPAIGGLIVGFIGYYAPHTLGVGYENITHILSGEMAMSAIVVLCVMKFVSWAIALGSGTSGGTLAPMLTIGGALGALMGYALLYYYPDSGVSIPLSALVGMMAMFAGASRALLTSIIFGLEATGQSAALLPLLAGCAASYFISFFLMENTIMTEKIARRGVKTPDSYEPDILEKINVARVMDDDAMVVSEKNTTKEVREWLENEPELFQNYFVVTNEDGEFKGILSASNLFSHQHTNDDMALSDMLHHQESFLLEDSSLRSAVELMAKEKVDVLPVLNHKNHQLMGILSYQNILSAYKIGFAEDEKQYPSISIKRRSMKVFLHGQKLFQKIDK
jgi:H+/Cl- antiporter ClcA